MKNVLALVAVITLTASISSASTTLKVWTTLVDATQVGGTYAFGTTPVTIGPAMALGTYGVQIWAQILGGTSGQGISDMAVTLYTPDTNGCFQPVGMGGAKVVTTFDLGLLVAGYTAMKPAYMHVASQYLGYASNPGNDYDANQAAIGDTGYVLPDYAVGAPVLVATEAWRLTSLGTSGVTLGVYVNPASRHWNAWAAIDANRAPYFLDDSDKTQFSSVIGQGLFIPEPFTMTMLGMGLSSLGMMIRRRRIVERRA